MKRQESGGDWQMNEEEGKVTETAAAVVGKKLRPDMVVQTTESSVGDDNTQPANDYKLNRLRQVLLRVLGLTCKELPAEIDTLFNSTTLDSFSDSNVCCLLESILLETVGLAIRKPESLPSLQHDDSLFDKGYSEPNSTSFVELNSVSGTSQERLFNYLIACYERLRTEENNNWIDSYEKDLLQHFWVRLLNAFAMFMEGAFTNGNNHQLGLLFTRALLMQTLPTGLLEDLVTYGHQDAGSLPSIFNPVLDCILRLANTVSLANQGEEFRKPANLLLELCSVSVRNTKIRPVCTLIAQRSDWIPDALSKAPGREIAKLSYFGPFLSLSIFLEEDTEVAEKFFAVEDLEQSSTKFVYGSLRANMQLIRGDVTNVFRSILINGESREFALNFITTVIDRNAKRAQLQANEAALAPDGFMLNFLSLMYELASKVTLDKVNTVYLYHPKSKIDLKDEARMKLDQEGVEKFSKKLDVSFEPKFPTECFFLTIHAQHLTLMPALRKNKNRMDGLRQIAGKIRTLENEIETNADPARKPRLVAKLKHWKVVVSKLKKAKLCAEAALLDEGLLSRAFNFCLKQLNFLVAVICPEFETNVSALPAEAPDLFGALPEFYLEDILDLLILMLKNTPQELIGLCHSDLLTQVLVFVCNTQYFNNPFLAAKSIEVIFLCCPNVQPAAVNLHNALLGHPLSQRSLFPSLVKFYADVEATGSHTEFFDKFSIRQQIQLIFKCLWNNGIYRHLMIEHAKACCPDFVRFTNMAINDAIFLLDESLQALKRIHDVEIRMSNKTEWEKLNREEQRTHRGVLQQDENSVRSWLRLAEETLDMFCFLTRDVSEPFLKEVLGNRLAEMLNFNLTQLCGPKCVNLKVQSPEKYKWEPRKLLGQIVEIYLNLDSETFAQYLAQDERSYSRDMFDNVLARLERNNIVPMSQVERLRNLSERVFVLWKENLEEEEDYGDIPEEFLDPIMGTLMKDPVRLPTSSKVMDKKHVQRHLLSDPTDPFSRQPLTIDQVLPETELKQQISDWIKQKRGARREGNRN